MLWLGLVAWHAWYAWWHPRLQLTLMSSAHMRLSNGRLSLNFSIRGSVLPVKRPPHSFFSGAGASGTEACGAMK